MKIRNFILGLGIFIVYALVLWQGVQTFYPSPNYDDYCEFPNRPVIKQGVDNCVFPVELNSKQDACYSAGGEFRYEYDNEGCISSGYCDECGIVYGDAQDVYSRNVFVFSLIAGVIVFVVGLFVLSVEPVGSALLASGVWSIFYGTVLNWRNFSNGLRFGILLVVLVLLILIALRVAKHEHFKFWKKK